MMSMTSCNPACGVSPLPAPHSTQSERDKLVLQYLPLVWGTAIRVRERLPVCIDLDDLVQAGTMGLFDAALKYNGEKQVSFQGYAKYRIKGAILDSLRAMDWASRGLRRRHKQLEVVTREVEAAMERSPTEAEIAEKMGMEVPCWRQAAIEMRMAGLVSASGQDENQKAPEFPATDRLNPDVIAGQRELRAFLSAAIKSLPNRYQKVIGLYHLGGKTMREIGVRMGINECRVSQINRAALVKMAVSLQAAGIHSSLCLV
jgi:RNA polymerase sigma factor for flagellar operon FliA